MFITFDNSAVRLTGRFTRLENAAVATATGSTIEIAFTGKSIVLHFDIATNEHPFPHLWIQVDNCVKVETVIDRYIRVEAVDDGQHAIKIIFKGAKEVQPRWQHPLVGKISFMGADVDDVGILAPDNRKTIELVGGSITEGVLIDALHRIHKEDQDNRPLQDDVTATYGYLTAEGLGLRSLHMGYGAVGVTCGGCGGVPKAADAYPYCFEGAPVSYSHPDYILINHGANDRAAGAELYIKEYRGLLDIVIAMHPQSKIIALSAFCGAFSTELAELVRNYNYEKKADIIFINSTGWVPVEPLHPLREGHRIIADRLIRAMKENLLL